MRGKGSAKKALNMFLDEIDALKLSVILSIVPRDKTTSAEGLKNFYLDFGFNAINDFQMIY
jgi:predicted acetyltransferase